MFRKYAQIIEGKELEYKQWLQNNKGLLETNRLDVDNFLEKIKIYDGIKWQEKHMEQQSGEQLF